MTRSDLIDISCHMHHRTERAVLISDDGDSDSAVWVPLSQCEVETTSDPSIITVTLPEWLAVEKGLV